MEPKTVVRVPSDQDSSLLEQDRSINTGLPENAGEGCSTEPLRHRTARAALTSGGAEVVTRVLGVVLSIVTARVLEPVEVGLLGLAVIIVGVISMLGSYPETAAVAARGKGSDRQYALASVQVRAVATAVLLGALWLAFSAVARILAGKEGGSAPLRELLTVLTLAPILELASGYPQVLMQRRLELSALARIQMVQPVVFVGVAVILLLSGRGYMGVAWASVIGSAVTAALVWRQVLTTRAYGWDGWPSRAIARETWLGTLKVTLGGFGGYLGGRIDNLVVSSSIGPTAMSFYSMAWNASRTPASVFGKAITFVLVPALARIQDDPARVQRALRECVRSSCMLLAPACAALFVTAPLLVSYVIGPKWLPLVPALRVMCFTVLCAPILFALAAFLTGTGRAHLVGIANAIQIAVLVGAIPPLASRWGVLGAAFADLLAVVALTTALYITARIATTRVDWRMAATGVTPVFAAGVAGALAWGLGTYIENGIARLASEMLLVLIGYLACILALGGRARLFDLSSLLRSIIRPQPLVNTQ